MKKTLLSQSREAATDPVADTERAAAWGRGAPGLKEVPRPSSFVIPVRRFEVGDQQVHLIPGGRAGHAGRGGVEVRETVLIAGVKRFFIAGPEGTTWRERRPFPPPSWTGGAGPGFEFCRRTDHG